MINEWQSPSFHAPLTQGFLVLVLFFFAIQAWARRRPDLTEVVVPLIFIASAFISVRNMPLASLVLAPFLAMNLGRMSWPAKAANNGGTDAPAPASVGSASKIPLASGREQFINWALLIVAGLALALSYPAQRKKQVAAVETYMPVGAADFIVANHIRGKMFNTYHYGGYLIFRLFPAQKVFIYGRTDIYPPGFVRNIMDNINRGRPDWKPLFDGYDFDYVVCESTAALRQLLLLEGRFKLVFDDGNHSVLLKNDDKFKDIIARHG